MSVINASRDERIHGHTVHEVHVNLRQLRRWDTERGSEAAMHELEAVRRELVEHGVAARSAARIASALARYAFLTEGGCGPSRRLLWRLYAVDGVPPEVLAQLTWQQVRIRLREIAVPGASATRYFALSDQTCRLLMAARSDSSETSGSTPVFVLEGGQAWQPEALARVLAAISVR